MFPPEAAWQEDAGVISGEVFGSLWLSTAFLPAFGDRIIRCDPDRRPPADGGGRTTKAAREPRKGEFAEEQVVVGVEYTDCAAYDFSPVDSHHGGQGLVGD